MEVVIVMLDTSADTDYKLLDYLKGVLTYDKEKIMDSRPKSNMNCRSSHKNQPL